MTTMALRFSSVSKSYSIIVGFLPMMLWCIQCDCLPTSLSSYGYVNQTVEAVVGDIAKLHCDTSVPQMNDSISVIVWFQDNRSSPICSLDKRNGSHHLNKNPEWASTSSFQFNEKLSVLKLQPVKRSHQGLYRCRVDFKRSQTREYIVNVTLIVPPEKLIISDQKNGEVRNNHLGPYRENETITIFCSAVGGSPPPRVTWWQDSSLLTERSERLENGTVRNSLRLRLTRGHLNTRYTCQASNNELNSLTTTVTLNMTVSPQSVKLVDAEKTMSAGQPYEISCYVYGAHPTPVIKWSKGNEKLKNYRKSDSNDGNLTISRLSFTPQPEDDGKPLSCAVDSSPSSAGQFSDSRRLNISYKPIVTIELGKNLNASAVTEGSAVYFECKVVSNTAVVKIVWKQNGKLLRHNASAGVLTQDSLVLQKVSRQQSGVYTCVVSNAEGESESNGVSLDVKFAPVCRNSSEIEYGVDRGEKVRVQCEVEANPATSTFAWQFSSVRTGGASKPSELTTETRSFIEFQPNSENDYGMLYCRANNSAGRQQQPCVFRIRPVGKPDTLSNCTITNRTSRSLLIRCVAGFDGGSEQRFGIEVRRQQHDKLVQNFNTDSPEFLINDLQSDVVYDFVIYAFNVKGRSPQSVQFNETLVDEMSNFISPASELAPMLRLPPLLLILAVLVVLLILLSCCIVIVVQSQYARRRKKRYMYKSKESLEKNPDIIPDKDDVSCTFEITTVGEEKQRPSKQTDIALILESSYGTDMNSDFVLHQDEYKKRKMFYGNKNKTSSLRKLNDYEITYASCDQPCPPFVTQDTPLLSGARVPFITEGQHVVHQCSIHGLSRSTSIS